MQQDDTNRSVTDNELDDFCHENHYNGWFTTSAKTGLNVKKGMNFIITKVMKNNKKLQMDNIEPEDTSKNIDFSKTNSKKQSGDGCSCQLI